MVFYGIAFVLGFSLWAGSTTYLLTRVVRLAWGQCS
jgi:hypothetical protein